MGSPTALIIHIQKLLTLPMLADSLSLATAQAMSAHHGGDVDMWQNAYQRIRADWDSYWADLDLNGDQSLEQWREGRWRVVRALFRLTEHEPPDNSRISFYLDDLPREIGRACPILINTPLIDLAKQYQIILLSPYLEGGLIRGMLDVVSEITETLTVIGPDELEQVGLEGVSGRWLTSIVGVTPESCILISDHPIAELRHIDSFDKLA